MDEPACLEPGPYVALLYDYVEDMVERRVPHRDAHLQRVREFKAAGELVNAGALGEHAEGAILLFAPGCQAAAERFADGDPYVVAGLVPSWRMTRWNVVA